MVYYPPLFDIRKNIYSVDRLISNKKDMNILKMNELNQFLFCLLFYKDHISGRIVFAHMKCLYSLMHMIFIRTIPKRILWKLIVLNLKTAVDMSVFHQGLGTLGNKRDSISPNVLESVNLTGKIKVVKQQQTSSGKMCNISN